MASGVGTDAESAETVWNSLLTVEEGGVTTNVTLTGLGEIATNELITSVTFTNNVLTLIEGGISTNIDLSSLVLTGTNNHERNAYDK